MLELNMSLPLQGDSPQTNEVSYPFQSTPHQPKSPINQSIKSSINQNLIFSLSFLDPVVVEVAVTYMMNDPCHLRGFLFTYFYWIELKNQPNLQSL